MAVGRWVPMSPSTQPTDRTALKVHSYEEPHRLFLMRATVFGVPIEVLHVSADSKATMRGKILSLVSIMNAAGADMDRGETGTL